MGALFNLIGIGIGVALYAMLLWMVLTADRHHSGPAQSRFDPLLLATALLGLVWNLCTLPVYEMIKMGAAGPVPILTAAGFTALGFLPAVVVQSVLRRRGGRPRDRVSSAIVCVAYAASGAAAVLHGFALLTGGQLPSAVGMRLLTYTFLALAAPLALVTRGQQSERRALWAAALAIFAVSGLHLSQFHQSASSWPVELLGHHASLPLVVAILYQDFPFALADIFLKRALTLVMLAGTAFLALISIADLGASGDPFLSSWSVGLTVGFWVATALLYPAFRAASAWFVDAVILRRPDYGHLRTALGAALQSHDRVPDVLDEVCQRLAPALSARHVVWSDVGAGAPAPAQRDSTSAEGATIEVPVAEPPHYQIAVRQLTGGRRLLFDDRTFLEAAASLAGRRIDAIRITSERYARELREQEMAALATQAELRALRSQINPHFLFNALTTIGFLIQTAPARALDTLMRLTSLLRGVLRSEGEMATLGRELELIAAYLDIEHARFEERLRVTIDVPGELRHLRIPALLVQPIVENAVKHGIAPERRGGDVLLRASLDNTTGTSMLVITVRDSGAGASDADLRRGREAGVGLKNVARRLAVQYRDAATLSVASARGAGTTVVLRIPAEQADAGEPVSVGQYS